MSPPPSGSGVLAVASGKSRERLIAMMLKIGILESFSFIA
jgi:hypothetical protein